MIPSWILPCCNKCWRNVTAKRPQSTVDGKKYVPSLPAEYQPTSLVKFLQISTDENLEIEVCFGSNVDDFHDHVVVKNTTYGGRFAIIRQIADASPARGKVMREIVENYVNKRIVPALSVDKKDKLAMILAKSKKFKLFSNS